ncbi:MAG: alginate lyase family protein [Phycisphaerae bacterium]|nr:alginate lyase family protein [Phycisphaerae bacterium]
MKREKSTNILRRIVLTAVLLTCCLIASTAAAQVAGLQIALAEAEHPFIACTQEELARLRRAYRGAGPEQKTAALIVRRADPFIKDPKAVFFPPRGGQHNQWYQCTDCELGLKTMNATKHRCPKCKKVYSGPPYDDVIFSRQHRTNLNHMLLAAWSYAITGREKYAERAAEVLLGYAERYTKYPYHSASRETKSSWGARAGGHLFEQTLTEASNLASLIAPAYDLIYDSKVLSKADHKKIRGDLLLPMLRNIDKNKAGKSNWQSWHNAAMLTAGALVGDEAWVRKAIDDPKNGFRHQMEISVSKDGMWYENSWGYHFYTLKALAITAEGARRLGIDLWEDPTFKKMFTLPAQYAMVRDKLPRLGDDVSSSLNAGGSFWEAPYQAYRDAAILPLLSRTPCLESILFGRRIQRRPAAALLGSKVFTGAGHAILRTEGKGALTAAMTFGPYGGFHGHFDKLSFVFYGHGQELGYDPGRAASQAYRLPIHTKWYKATIGHNTVLADGKSQQPAAGKLELFAANPKCAAAVASCSAAYPGVKHKRLLLMTETYLLVLDRLTADKATRFDWLYHNEGSRILTDLATQPADIAADFTGAEYIQNILRAATDNPVRLKFIDERVSTHLTMDAQPGTRVILGDGPGSSVTHRVPLTMITRSGTDVTFAAVLEPVKPGAKPHVTNVSLNRTDSDLTITVNLAPQTDTIHLTPDNRLTVKTADKEILAGN